MHDSLSLHDAEASRAAARRAALLQTACLRGCVMVLAIAASLLAGLASGQTVERVSPLTVPPGVTSRITLTGSDLAGLHAAITGGSVVIESSEPTQAVLAVTLPAEAIGGVGLWLAGPSGPLEPQPLLVDDLPATAETADNHTPATAQPITIGMCVDGTADGPQADFFRFAADAGQRMACEVRTQSLGSSMDPVVILRDAAGRQLLLADDDGVSPECRFEHRFDTAGEYLLALRDSRHSAGGRYHLRLGSFPLLASCQPLAVQRGQPTSLSVTTADGRMLPAVPRLVSTDDRRDTLWVAFRDGESHTAWQQVALSDLPQVSEEAGIAALTLPVGISGRLGEAHETDEYTLTVTAGEPLRITSRTRSLGLPTLAVLELVNADGTVLAATAPDVNDEWTLQATPPTDGELRLRVRDLLGRGGTAFGYHLSVTQGGSVAVALAGDANTRERFPLEPDGGAIVLPLSVARFGYDGAIVIAIDPPVAGLSLLDGTIPAAATSHRVFLTADATWQPNAQAVVRLTARDEAGGPPSVVSSLALQRAKQPRVPYPEAWLEGSLALGGVAGSPAPYTLSVSPTAFARSLTSHRATLTIARTDERFKDGISLLGSGMPAGWSLATSADKDIVTATLSRSPDAGEPASLPLVAYAELEGRGRLTRLDLPVSWIDPLAVSAASAGTLVAGRDNGLPLTIVRTGDDPQPVTVTVTGLPEGWPLPPPLTVAADATQATLTLSLPPMPSSSGGTLSFEAATQYHGQALSISGSLPLPAVLGTPERIEVFPTDIELASRHDRRQLVVTGFDAAGGPRDWTRDVVITSTDPAIAAVEGTAVVPAGDGQAEIIVAIGGLEQRLPVRVSGSGQARPVAFESEVLVALSKQGCSSGACHGSPSGKGMFRLSLRGFDPVLDELTLIREDLGRRVNAIEPAESLLVAKPLMQVSHGGGKKLHTDDVAHDILLRWIAEGARGDAPDTSRCTSLEIFPREKRLLPLTGGGQQIAVIAHFADGSSRDVTRLAAYEASDVAVASVDADGLVTPAARGETVILARFLEHIEALPLTFLDPDPTFVWQAPPPHNFIDELVDEKLRLLRYPPSPVCSDDEFLRRVHLDVIGLLPTVEETRAFLADASPDKRSALIARLLDRDEYARFAALAWGDLLRMTVKAVGDDGVHKYHRWVEDAFRRNMPYDQFARALLAAEGSTLTNPPANFYRAAATATDCVETVSQVFLGARLQCAKCHNHPFEKWTQDNYYGLAAFFEPISRRQTPRPGEMFIHATGSGTVTQPRTGKTMQPWLPGKGEIAVDAGRDARLQLVDWLVSPDNPLFARIEANRIWSGCFARGIVDPIDDFRDSNPPANGPLLDALARFFIDTGFDRKALLRTILESRTYQASVVATEANRDDLRCFSHQQPRLLSAEQLLDAIGQVTQVPEAFAGLPAETRATQLPAPDVAKVDFLEIFGQPQRSTVCACERTSDSNLGMAIAMFNGELMHAKLAAEGNRFRRGLAEGRSVDALVEELYLASVCRLPSDEERAAALTHIAGRESPADGLEDVCWALLNTDEFLFQH